MKSKPAKTENNPLKAVGYIRVSMASQELGLDAQRAALETWARSRGVELVAVFVDHGVSGAAALDARPGLLAAIDALTVHGAGIMVASRRDRIARDVVAAAMIERLTVRAGAVVTTADGVGDSGGPEGALMKAIVDAFSAYERQIIKGRTKAALAVKKSRGEVWNGSLPYGLTRASDGVHVGPDSDEAKVVSAIRDLASAGWTCRAIAAELERRGVVNRRNNPHHFTAVAKILREGDIDHG